jgi:hypothetical protein
MIFLPCNTKREEIQMSSVIEKVKVQPKVGDILYSSWGYDQTNIEFFKVVKVSEFSVWIQEVGAKVVEVTGWAHEKVVPTDSSDYQVRNWDNEKDAWGNVNAYITKTHPIQRKKIQTYGGGYGVSLNSFSSAWLWDGKPKEASHTH